MSARQQANAKVADFRRRADALDEIADAPGPSVPEHGQPILVGHHSERAHRRMMDRAARVWDRQAEAAELARALRRQATALEVRTAWQVFDDDPDAIERLSAEIDGLERTIEKLKDGAVSSMGPLQRKDAIATIRRQIRARRARIARLTNPEEADDA